MNFFTFDIRKVILVTLAVILPLIAVNIQRNSEEELWFTKPFTMTASMIQIAYFSFSAGVRGTTANYLDLIGIKTQNRLLLRENGELRAQLGALTELKLENERLSQLLGLKQRSTMDLLATRVIGHDALLDHDTVSVNKGSEHGVKKHMAAITVSGIVGYVFRVEKWTSQILLLTDRYSAVDAIVQRSRVRGIVEGKSRDGAMLKYLRRSDDVEVGDLVVTSGLHNIFPKGFPVGTVTAIQRSEYGMSQDVQISPIVNPRNLEEVFVILNASQEDFTPPPEEPPDPTAPAATSENPVKNIGPLPAGPALAPSLATEATAVAPAPVLSPALAPAAEKRD